jgi:hypothetical protein
MIYVATRFLFAFLLTGLPAGLAAWLGVSSLKRWDPMTCALLSPVLGLGAWFFALACLGQPDAFQALDVVHELSPQILGIMLGAAIGSVTGAFVAEQGSRRGVLAGYGSLVGSSMACMVFLNQALDGNLSF